MPAGEATTNGARFSTMSGSPSSHPGHDRIEWYGPHLTNNELDRLHQGCLASGYINDGPLAREFEHRVAALVGTDYAVAVTSGTAAIALALLAAGTDPGMEVLVPDLTFIATANAVRLAGAHLRS